MQQMLTHNAGTVLSIQAGQSILSAHTLMK
jgi:hypothetical protein